jgi:hypothetical protein
MLYNDYFADEATQVNNFQSCYRMSMEVFTEILHGVREYDDFFKLKHDIVGMASFSSI